MEANNITQFLLNHSPPQPFGDFSGFVPPLAGSAIYYSVYGLADLACFDQSVQFRRRCCHGSKTEYLRVR